MSNNLGLDYLAPTSFIGILILILGIFFTAGTVLLFLNLNKDSITDRQSKEYKREEQIKAIKRLYPKE